MSVTKTRAWIAGTVVLCLLISLAAWFLLISPKRSEAADVRSQTLAAVQANDQQRAKIAELKKQAETLPQKEAELATLREAMPKDDELAALTRSLQNIEKDSGAMLDSISPATPIAVTAAAAEAEADPKANAGGLVRVPVTVVVTGNYQKSLAFLKGMQTNMPRNYLVSGINIGEPQLASNANKDVAQAEGWVTMTITGSVFALPESAAPAAAPAAGATTAAATTSTDS